MKKEYILFLLVAFCFCDYLFASRRLDHSEILSILKTLTDSPMDCWISHGQIKGTHNEYSSSDNCIVESTEFIDVDGDKFYWEINFLPEQTTGNISAEKTSDILGNAKRMFVWDGQRYSMYFETTNNAIVTEDTSQIPINVSGILKAGVIPWGYGKYTFENLSQCELSAIENYKNQIVLSIKNAYEMELILNPADLYSVERYQLILKSGVKLVYKYSDFSLVGDKYIPSNIIIEKYDKNNTTNDLLSRDHWQISEITLSDAKQNTYTVPYKNNAYIDFYPSEVKTRLSYNYSKTTDTELLLQKKLEMISTANSSSGNCATHAVKQVFSAFDKEVGTARITTIIENQGETSLYRIRNFIRESGLQCTAINIDFNALNVLQNCEVILYLSESKHYVVLDKINSKYAWLIDYESDKFYYRMPLRDFSLLWPDRLALIISDDMGSLPSGQEISDDQAKSIIGASGRGIPNYSCTDLILEERTIQCPTQIDGDCNGRYWKYSNMYGCIEDETGGICIGSNKIGKVFCDCDIDQSNLDSCDLTYSWVKREIHACN